MLLECIRTSEIQFSWVIPSFCLNVLVTVLLVQPYKEPYALHNKLDAVMICLIIASITCTFPTTIVTKEGHITYKACIVVADIVALAPLLYFTVKFLQLLKHVLQNVCLCCHIFYDPNIIQRGDYKDLNVAEVHLNSVN